MSVAEAYCGFARTEYARRIIGDAVEAVVGVDAEEDVVEADEDEAPIRACQARGCVGDEGTRWCCQHRACVERDQYELRAMSRDLLTRLQSGCKTQSGEEGPKPSEVVGVDLSRTSR
jgi:hypothetical protein